MSTDSLLANLPENIRKLVSGTKIDESHPEAEKKEIANWITKATDSSFVSQSSLPNLNTELTSRTYLVGNSISSADIALYGLLHPIISKLGASEYYSTPALTRYFDHIQHDPALRANTSAPAIISFDFTNAPKQERKAEDPAKKKKEKKEGDAAAVEKDAEVATSSKKQKQKAVATEDSATAEEAGASTPAKKEKKEKAKKEPAGGKAESSKGGAAAADDNGVPIPSMIDLRVGKIVDIKVHPDADGLYVEQIDFAEPEGPRTVISGLVHYIPIEQMRDRLVVGVCNLKPANMRGIKSHAMVLCATSKDGKDGGVECVVPPEGSTPGDKVYFEGYEGKEPISQLNPKKKIFETIQPGFTVLDSTEAAWVDPATKSSHRIITQNGICKAPTHIGGTLS